MKSFALEVGLRADGSISVGIHDSEDKEVVEIGFGNLSSFRKFIDALESQHQEIEKALKDPEVIQRIEAHKQQLADYE